MSLVAQTSQAQSAAAVVVLLCAVIQVYEELSTAALTGLCKSAAVIYHLRNVISWDLVLVPDRTFGCHSRSTRHSESVDHIHVKI